MTDIMSALRALFDGPGGQEYLGEAVSTAEHMLQCAAVARAAGAPDHLVVAALVHDVGHLTGPISGVDLMAGTDNHHDAVGARWLGRWFGVEVTEPVRLHVAAKRYLCAIDPGYADGLSAASVYTMALQGGPMTAAEAAAFGALPSHTDAVAVRRWDDEGKDPRRPTPTLDDFAAVLGALSHG